MSKKVSIVGVGMNGAKTMTTEALSAVNNADVIIGAKRMVELFKHLNKATFVSYISEEISEYICSCEYENIAVLMSGDCGFYSGTEKLLPLIKEFDTEVLCGISSPIYFCSKLKIPWSDLHFVSLHGKSGNIVRNVCSHRKTFFLFGGDISPKIVCQKLCEYELNNVRVYIGENLSYENERILCGVSEDFTELETDKLCVMVVENSNFEKHKIACIPDEQFIRRAVPMTKAEVRSLCISKLEIGLDDVCWDIGCGTGSVSVEMAVCCTDGKVFAVDKNEEAVVLTDENRHKFGCDNIAIIPGKAENIVLELPTPNCVFIGGSSGELETIVNVAYSKNPNVKLVITAVSLETLNEAVSVLEKNGVSAEISQIAVTRTKKIGSHTMFKAENPIFIIKGVR